MKNFILLTGGFILFLAACQQTEKEDTELSTLIDKRDSIQKKIDTLTIELKDFEAQIAELDTVKKAPLVASTQIKNSEFNHYFKVQGNVESDKNATLFPETQGLIKAIHVKEGQKVAAGQRLMTLDNDIIANSIAEVETSLSLATDVFERQERLWNQNIGSEMQFLEAKNRKEQLEQSIATLRKQQSMAILKAPFSGVVDQIYPKVGEMGSPASPAISIVNLRELHTVADVSEKYLGKVSRKMPVSVSIGNGLDTLNGMISNIGSSINPANRTFQIKVDFTDKSEILRPNLLAEIVINDFKVDSAIVIPEKYVLQDIEGNSFVYAAVKEKNKKREKYVAKKMIIEKGQSYNGEVLVLNGLKPGDHVITDGARKLTNGEEIRLTAE